MQAFLAPRAPESRAPRACLACLAQPEPRAPRACLAPAVHWEPRAPRACLALLAQPEPRAQLVRLVPSPFLAAMQGAQKAHLFGIETLLMMNDGSCHGAETAHNTAAHFMDAASIVPSQFASLITRAWGLQAFLAPRAPESRAPRACLACLAQPEPRAPRACLAPAVHWEPRAPRACLALLAQPEPRAQLVRTNPSLFLAAMQGAQKAHPVWSWAQGFSQHSSAYSADDEMMAMSRSRACLLTTQQRIPF